MRQIERVRRARSQLVMGRHPFYGCLALGLKLETSDGTGIGTMATDGKRLVVNEDWVSKLSDDELRGVIVHEVMHIAYGHPFRRGHRDHRQWNVAGDYAINRDLIQQGFTLPGSRLFDPRFDGMSAEQIFATMAREAEKQRSQQQQQQRAKQPGSGAGQGQKSQSEGDPEDEDDDTQQAGGPSPSDDLDPEDDEPEDGEPGGEGDEPEPDGDEPKDGEPEGGDTDSTGDPGGCGEVLDAADPASPLDLEEAEAEWKAKVLAAAAIAKAQAGDLPAEIERLVTEQRKPGKQNWRMLLRRFVTQSISQDYTWARANRRFVGRGLYLPSLQSDAVDHVLIAVDTSGSIDRQALAAFGEEMQDIFGSGICDKITVIYCDVEIHGEPAEFTSGDNLVFTPVGGGGTDFAPVMEWAAEQQAACLIYFTDLLCRSFGEDPGLPVLWARWDSFEHPHLPFGEVIEIDPHA